MIAVEDHDGAPGRTRMARVPDVKRDTLTDFVLDHAARGAEVRTDAYHGYDDVGRHRFGHVVVNLKESGDPAHIVMPHVHRVASLLKRWPLGTHRGAVTHAQLDYYLDEFVRHEALSDRVGCKDPTAGPSQRPGEAEGSLTPELREGRQAALTTTRRAGTIGLRGRGKQGGTV